MKQVTYFLALAFWFIFAQLLLCSSDSDSSGDSSDSSDDSSSEFVGLSDSEHSNAVVKITSLEWISQVPYLADLEGITVRNGLAGHLESLKIVSKVFLRGPKYPKQLAGVFFEELLKLWRADPAAFKEYSYRMMTFCNYDLIKEFTKLAVINNEFELANVLAYKYTGMYNMDSEIAEILSPYFLAHPDQFSSACDGNGMRFVLNLDLSEAQLMRIFRDDSDWAVYILQRVCNTYPSLSPEVKKTYCAFTTIFLKTPNQQLKG